MSITKRFIAGAICPRCAAMDRIVTYVTDEGRFRECVNCDFHEKLKEEVPGVAEPETRISRPRPTARTEAQPLRFYRKPPRSSH